MNNTYNELHPIICYKFPNTVYIMSHADKTPSISIIITPTCLVGWWEVYNLPVILYCFCIITNG